MSGTCAWHTKYSFRWKEYGRVVVRLGQGNHPYKWKKPDKDSQTYWLHFGTTRSKSLLIPVLLPRRILDGYWHRPNTFQGNILSTVAFSRSFYVNLHPTSHFQDPQHEHL